LVLNHLCAESYSHRFTLQYALWDLLRESAGTNVAKTMAYITARGSMDLTVFKVYFVSAAERGVLTLRQSTSPR
jgi:nucleolar MIF4G domain-containing protein 1